MKLSTVEKNLNDNGVIYLGFLEYGTSKKDFRLAYKFQKESEFLIDLIVGKIEKDLNVDWVHDTNLGISFFEVHEDSEWYVVIHNINTQTDSVFKIKDILNGTEYLNELEKEEILYID